MIESVYEDKVALTAKEMIND